MCPYAPLWPPTAPYVPLLAEITTFSPEKMTKSTVQVPPRWLMMAATFRDGGDATWGWGKTDPAG